MAGDNKQTPPGMERQFADVLESAAKLYKDNTGEALSLQSFTTPPMRTVEDLKLQLSRQNEDFAAFRAKRQNIFSVLSAALKPVVIPGDVTNLKVVLLSVSVGMHPTLHPQGCFHLSSTHLVMPFRM